MLFLWEATYNTLWGIKRSTCLKSYGHCFTLSSHSKWVFFWRSRHLSPGYIASALRVTSPSSFPCSSQCSFHLRMLSSQVVLFLLSCRPCDHSTPSSTAQFGVDWICILDPSWPIRVLLVIILTRLSCWHGLTWKTAILNRSLGQK